MNIIFARSLASFYSASLFFPFILFYTFLRLGSWFYAGSCRVVLKKFTHKILHRRAAFKNIQRTEFGFVCSKTAPHTHRYSLKALVYLSIIIFLIKITDGFYKCFAESSQVRQPCVVYCPLQWIIFFAILIFVRVQLQYLLLSDEW